MILLLGGTGYVGTAYQKLFSETNVEFRSVSRREIDYSTADGLRRLLAETKPSFLINAAGYTGKPNVDACELHKTDCLFGNAVFPGIVAAACGEAKVPWGHVSSGCIYSGRRPDGAPFREDDAPNFSFRTDNCSFYSGTKALGEEVLSGAPNCYLWRLRIPFNHVDNPRNYLTKLMRYDRLLDAENSISQLEEFVSATYACWQKQIPFGTYNVTNPGAVWSREVVEQIVKSGVCKKNFSFFDSEDEFMSVAAKTPRSNCVMDSSKLESAGIKMTPVSESIERALRNWVPAS
jgi:dTDP-4-dehydrorhamnose reductase